MFFAAVRSPTSISWTLARESFEQLLYALFKAVRKICIQPVFKKRWNFALVDHDWQDRNRSIFRLLHQGKVDFVPYPIRLNGGPRHHY